MQPWMAEWKKFSDRSIERMKSYSDDTNEEREWMCYVYDVDGTYELGEPSYGTLSRIEVSPEGITKKGDYSRTSFERWKNLHRKAVFQFHRYLQGIC